MSAKLKAAILKNAVSTAQAIAKADHEAGNLANELLKSMAEAKRAGLTIEVVWSEIARDGGYQDKANKLEGDPMPKTLQAYRSRLRKGEALGANFELNWPMFLADVKRLTDDKRVPRPSQNQDSVDQSTGSMAKVEAKPLAEIAIPASLARAIGDKRLSLSVEQRAKFDDKLTAWVATWGM